MAEEYMKQLVETVALQQKQIANLIDAIKLKIGIAAPVAVNVQPAVVDPLVARAEKSQIVQDCQMVQDCPNFRDKVKFTDKAKFTDKSKCLRQVQNFILRINLSRNE